MLRLDLTLPTAAENVALDEALLDWAENGREEVEVLRIWESPQPAVVIGRSSRVELEVNDPECRQRNVPVIRRSSGGAAIVAGPGCLMYALVLSYQRRPQLKDIRHAHDEVLSRFTYAFQQAIGRAGIVSQAGTSDLVFLRKSEQSAGDLTAKSQTLKKFAGNSLRAKRSHMLYHGTLLYDFDLSLIGTCLLSPPRQPEYRERRDHGEFVMNLPLSRQALLESVGKAWPTEIALSDWPAAGTAKLVEERFGQDRWNLEFP